MNSDPLPPALPHAAPDVSPAPVDEPLRFSDGHFYSPTVDFREIADRASKIWPKLVGPVMGIDFNDDSHRQVLEQMFPRLIREYAYPEKPAESSDSTVFFTQNSQFSWLDARLLFVLLRAYAPRQIVEVGSGYSSLLIGDVNRRFFASHAEVTCIDPYPREFMKNAIQGISRLIEEKVQDVDLVQFERLECGDMLFIDSSHVSKTGSDVNFLFFEVLPRLEPGVLIHFHDIFFPHEYPEDWVLGEGRSWNEQYLLRALLMYSTAFKVVFGSSYAFHRYPELVKQALNLPSGKAFAGGSFWIERL